MATWMKDPETGERVLITPSTAPKARCCVQVAEVKAALPKEPEAFVMPTLLTEDELQNAYSETSD